MLLNPSQYCAQATGEGPLPPSYQRESTPARIIVQQIRAHVVASARRRFADELPVFPVGPNYRTPLHARKRAKRAARDEDRWGCRQALPRESGNWNQIAKESGNQQCGTAGSIREFGLHQVQRLKLVRPGEVPRDSSLEAAQAAPARSRGPA